MYIRFQFPLRMSLIFPTEVTFGGLEGSPNLDSSKLTAQLKKLPFPKESRKYFNIFCAKRELTLLFRCNF